MLCMTAFGVGEMLGGLLIGFVIDSKGNKIATLVNLGLITL